MQIQTDGILWEDTGLKCPVALLLALFNEPSHEDLSNAKALAIRTDIYAYLGHPTVDASRGNR